MSCTPSPYCDLTINISPGLAYGPGDYLMLYCDDCSYINGKVVSYNIITGELVISPYVFEGSGQCCNWTVNLSGVAGTNGTSGTSGINGTSGLNGTSGINGSSGTSGTSGTTGTSGTSGLSGQSANLFLYKANTVSYSGDPGTSHILWNNVTQISSTQININHITNSTPTDIDIFLALLQAGQTLTIQDRSNSGNYQKWLITGTPTYFASSYWTVPVSLIISAGTGTTNYANELDIALAILAYSGTNGTSGTSGVNGIIGSNGTSGTSGVDGIIGSNGTSGTSGSSGLSVSYGLIVATSIGLQNIF